MREQRAKRDLVENLAIKMGEMGKIGRKKTGAKHKEPQVTLYVIGLANVP